MKSLLKPVSSPFPNLDHLCFSAPASTRHRVYDRTPLSVLRWKDSPKGFRVAGDEWRSLDHAAAAATLKHFIPSGIAKVVKDVEIPEQQGVQLSKSHADLVLAMVGSNQRVVIEVERLTPGEHSHYSSLLREASSDLRRARCSSRERKRAWAGELRDAHQAMLSDYTRFRGMELQFVPGELARAEVRIVANPVDIHLLLTEKFASCDSVKIPRFQDFVRVYDKIRGQLYADREVAERGPRVVVRTHAAHRGAKYPRY